MAVEQAVKRVIEHADFAKTFRHPLKFDGTNFVEKRLSVEEQTAEVTRLASSALHVFLERYGTMLLAEDLHALGTLPAAATAEVRFWLERLLREPVSETLRKKQSRRRRWLWARREMAQSNGFFSEDEMKRRDPQLFHRLVGRHLDSGVQLSAPMQGSLSAYLMQRLDLEVEEGRPSAAGSGQGDGCAGGEAERQSAKRVRCEGHPVSGSAESGAANMEDGNNNEGEVASDSNMEDDSPSDPGEGGAPDDVAVKRARFLKAMRDRFVNGAEPGFEYSALDEDSELDDIVELGRDAEEQYFDDD